MLETKHMWNMGMCEVVNVLRVGGGGGGVVWWDMIKLPKLDVWW